MDIIRYTDNEIKKNFALLEQHLKQAPSGDESFCEDCINKHLMLLEGLAEEGMNAGGDPEKYQKVYDFVNEIKDEDYQEHGIKFSSESRKIRKSLSNCPTCNLPKGLNNPDTFNYDTHTSDHINGQDKINGEKYKMTDFKAVGMMNIGQFAAEGVKYLVETQFPTAEPYASIGGGVALQALPLLLKKMPKGIKSLLAVAGSNLLAYGVVKLIRKTTVPVVTAKAGMKAGNPNGYAGKSFSQTPSFGGPTFAGKVTATNIPSQYARAGILGGAQAFEAPEHADLIRVD